ncbi:MAG: TraR/DksA family transcriptional regulator [Pseudomonadota bacterium]
MDHETLIETLKKRKAWLEDSLEKIEQTLDAPPSKDFEDRATEREGDEVLESLGTSELAELKQVNTALARVAAGTYGICVRCGEPIAQDRLIAVPHAARCRACA